MILDEVVGFLFLYASSFNMSFSYIWSLPQLQKIS